ncbi:MAG: hypothetical protein K2Y29_00165 [Beijerinckiaceae bacterium]|nr:hypothetical protein [Beijerinckiaceae bacterium]
MIRVGEKPDSAARIRDRMKIERAFRSADHLQDRDASSQQGDGDGDKNQPFARASIERKRTKKKSYSRQEGEGRSKRFALAQRKRQPRRIDAGRSIGGQKLGAGRKHAPHGRRDGNQMQKRNHRNANKAGRQQAIGLERWPGEWRRHHDQRQCEQLRNEIGGNAALRAAAKKKRRR